MADNRRDTRLDRAKRRPIPLEFIMPEKRRRAGILDQSVAIDMDLGDTDDFEIRLPQEEWTKRMVLVRKSHFLYREQNTAES